VSIKVTPLSKANRNVAISESRVDLFSPIRHVPSP